MQKPVLGSAVSERMISLLLKLLFSSTEPTIPMVDWRVKACAEIIWKDTWCGRHALATFTIPWASTIQFPYPERAFRTAREPWVTWEPFNSSPESGSQRETHLVHTKNTRVNPGFYHGRGGIPSLKGNKKVTVPIFPAIESLVNYHQTKSAGKKF